MPYFLKQVGKKYYVVDTTGKHYSKTPLPKARAERQLKALHINTGHGYGGADDGEDLEMAGLMQQEPVAFMAAPGPVHNPFAGLFEPVPRRIQRQRQKRAISTVQGAIPISAQKRQRTGFGRKKRGGNKWPRVRLIAEDIKNVQKINKKEAAAGANSRPYPYQTSRHMGRVYVPTLTPLPNIQQELFKLVQDGSIDPRDVPYYERKLQEYLSLTSFQQSVFAVPDPVYRVRKPEVLLGRPGTQESAEEALLNLPIGNEHVAEREAEEEALLQKYISKLPTRAQVKKTEEQSEGQQLAARQSLAQRQGQLVAFSPGDPRGQGRGTSRYSQPDIHILVGDVLEGSGTGKWTALINALARMYSIPKALVDSTIALNDRQSGKYRFSSKKKNILSQFSDYLNPTIVNEIGDLDESDPTSVSDYANTINGRSEMALNLRAVNTVNPLQVSVATSNPLRGRGTGKWSNLIYELGRLDNLTAPMIERAINRNDRIVHSDPRERFALKKQNVLESFPRRREPLDQLLDYDTFDNLRARQVIDSLRANRQRTPAVQQGNPLHQAQQLAVNASFPVEPTQAVGVVDMVSNPGCIGCGGKLKFIKKYLKGQGLPATKKNVTKICNIMDVEGVLFE
jgi:hypothetical protein